MKYWILYSLMIFAQWAFAESYVVEVQFGEKTTQYHLDFQKDKCELSKSDEPNRKVRLNSEDSKFLREQIASIRAAKSDQIEFCKRSYIALFDQKKMDSRISCINSTTGISKKATTLANSLVSAYRFL